MPNARLKNQLKVHWIYFRSRIILEVRNAFHLCYLISDCSFFNVCFENEIIKWILQIDCQNVINICEQHNIYFKNDNISRQGWQSTLCSFSSNA